MTSYVIYATTVYLSLLIFYIMESLTIFLDELSEQEWPSRSSYFVISHNIAITGKLVAIEQKIKSDDHITIFDGNLLTSVKSLILG